MNPSASAQAVPGRTLFLTYQCPSSGGSGPQIRAAALLRMLAARGGAHVIAVNRYEQLPGPVEIQRDRGYEAITYLRLLPDEATAGRRIRLVSEIPHAEVPTVDCALAAVPDFVAGYARKHGLDQLFVFRLETLFFVHGCLDEFSLRLLDLDDFPSRRDRAISALKDAVPTAEDKRAQLATQVWEKKFLPRFHHVFVASAVDAAEIRRALFSRVTVLPNVRPRRPALVRTPRTERREILFVGMLSYFPNEDGVLWFCREVLPLLQARLGDTMLFRIIGFGQVTALEPLRNLPGVDLVGYQADLAPAYARATLAVVPLRAGSGTRLKILEAFASDCPVVSTSVGAEGLNVTDGKNILLADRAEAFAAACLSVLEDPALAWRLAQGGRQLQEEEYSDEALLRHYDEALKT